MLTINFRGMTPVRARWVPPGRDLTHTAPAQPRERRAWRRVLGERFSAYRGPRLREHLAASLLLLGNVRDLSGGSDWSVRAPKLADESGIP